MSEATAIVRTRHMVRMIYDEAGQTGEVAKEYPTRRGAGVAYQAIRARLSGVGFPWVLRQETETTDMGRVVACCLWRQHSSANPGSPRGTA